MNRDILLEAPLGQCHELLLSQKKHGTFVLKSGNPKGMLAFHMFKNHLSHHFPIGFPFRKAVGNRFFVPFRFARRRLSISGFSEGFGGAGLRDGLTSILKAICTLYIYIYICIYVCMYIYICICIYTYVYIYVYVYVYLEE